MAAEKAAQNIGDLSKVERLLQEALALDENDREALADALDDSFETEDEWDEDYAAELRRRLAEIKAGGPTYSLKEVVDSLRVPPR